MKTASFTPAIFGILLGIGLPVTGQAQNVGSPDPAHDSQPSVVSHANCDKVAEAVRQAVEKDPAKLLPIVEDFMITNESCACEIVKAATLASHANTDQRRQIATTAIDIAPQQRQLITDCLEAFAKRYNLVEHVEGALGTPTTNAASSQSSNSGDSDYSLPADMRGVYFIQPISGIALSTSGPATTGGPTTTTTTHTTSGPTNPSPPNGPSPLSPSTGAP